MNEYCIDLDLDLPLFNSALNPVEFLKQHYQITNHFQVDIKDISDELKSFFTNQNLSIKQIEIFYRRPNNVGNIHSDTEIVGDYSKLNWVYGDGIMNWYKTTKDYTPTVLTTTSIKSYALYYKTSEVELVHSQKVGQPSLVQVGVPHNVINGASERFCVSIEFEFNKIRPTFAEAQLLFKDYIR